MTSTAYCKFQYDSAEPVQWKTTEFYSKLSTLEKVRRDRLTARFDSESRELQNPASTHLDEIAGSCSRYVD